MKRIISAFLLSAIMTLLCACGNVAEVPVATVTPEPETNLESSELNSTSDEDFTVFIARFSTRTESFNDPAGDGVEILSYSVTSPSVEVPGNEEISGIINDSIGTVNSAYFRNEEGSGTEMDRETEMLSMAEDNYAYYKSGNADNISVRFSFTRTAEIADADGESFVLKFTNTIDANGTETEEEYYRFSTVTGEMELLSADEVDIILECGEVERIPEGQTDNSGEILDLVILDENGEDFLYGPEKGSVAYNVNIASVWFCNRMENNYVQVREKA